MSDPRENFKDTDYNHPKERARREQEKKEPPPKEITPEELGDILGSITPIKPK